MILRGWIYDKGDKKKFFFEKTLQVGFDCGRLIYVNLHQLGGNQNLCSTEKNHIETQGGLSRRGLEETWIGEESCKKKNSKQCGQVKRVTFRQSKQDRSEEKRRTQGGWEWWRRKKRWAKLNGHFVSFWGICIGKEQSWGFRNGKVINLRECEELINGLGIKVKQYVIIGELNRLDAVWFITDTSKIEFIRYMLSINKKNEKNRGMFV